MTRVTQQTPSHSLPRLEGFCILLVEDEPEMTALLTFILEEERAQVMAVAQAEDALALLDTLRPDLMLCNVKLPHHDGDWLVQQIRGHASAQVRQLPTIAVSSYTREVAGTAMIDAGFDRFLPKTFDPDDLVLTMLDLMQGNPNSGATT